MSPPSDSHEAAEPISDDVARLESLMAALQVQNAELRATIAVQNARIAELERQLGLNRGLPHKWGSGGRRHWWAQIVCRLEFLSKVGAKRAIINRAANLQQKVSTPSRPPHLL